MSSRSLSLAGVSFGFVTDLFFSVDLDLGPGWHGPVGPNGAGETTLLSIMSRELSPRDGTVSRSGRSVQPDRREHMS
jgi:ABC-type multidrug transport system ATPase subunit